MRSVAAAVACVLVLAGCKFEPVEGLEPGNLAPNFTVAPLQGDGRRRLHDLRGKVVLIDYWATWCGPCKEISPTVKALYEKHKGNGFEVMAISNESPDLLKTYDARMKPGYPIYHDFAGMAEGALKIEAYPTFVLLDREGKIVLYSQGGDEKELTEAVERAMAR